MTDVRAPSRSSRRWTAATVVLILLLVVLNAPQFLLVSEREKNAFWHTPIKNADGAGRPECHLPLRSVVFGPRDWRMRRQADLHFLHERRDPSCPHTYRLIFLTTVLTHAKALEAPWRGDIEKEEERCPISRLSTSEVSTAADRDGKLVVVDLDLRYVFHTAIGQRLPCLPRLTFTPSLNLASLDRQFVTISNMVETRPSGAADPHGAIEVYSENKFEDVSVRHLAGGQMLSVVLADYRVAAVVGILNIVLASLLGVAAAAVFSRPDQVG